MLEIQEDLDLDFKTISPKVMVGLSWDPNEQSNSVLGGITPHNADLICAVLDESKDIIDVITPQNVMRDKYKACLFHKGDNLSGGSDNEDEEVIINFDAMPENIHMLAFAVGLKGGVRFSEVENGQLAFKNSSTLQDFLTVPFEELMTDMAEITNAEYRQVLAAYFIRSEKGWKLSKCIKAMRSVEGSEFEEVISSLITFDNMSIRQG